MFFKIMAGLAAVLLLGAGCVSSKEYQEIQERLAELQSCVEEANDRIDELNDQIQEANDLAWSSYEEMGTALANLQEAARLDCS